MNFARPRMGAAALLLFLAAAVPACQQVQQQLSGSPDQGPALQHLRETLAAKRSRLANAVQSGQIDFVPGYLNEMSATLDSLEAQSSKMSFMDGQDMRLKVASARKVIQSAQPFVMENDAEGVKAQQANLDQILFEIDGILEKAAMMTNQPSATGGT